jgi:transposase-like protein
MKNEIQLQKGLSLSEFQEKYGVEALCESEVEKAQWPEGFVCPKCTSKSHCVVWHGRVKTFQCNSCHTQTTLRSGTIFHSSKLTLVKWFQAMFFMTQSKNSISALELKRHLGVSYRTSWLVTHKLMQIMLEKESTTKLSGRIEADDAYLGGENSGGKAGRGSENKVPFIAAVQTNKNGNPVYAVFSQVKTFSRKEILAFSKRSIVPLSTVVTDGLACFAAFAEAGCIHRKEVVGKKRKSTDMECFTWVNTILGNLKTSLSGTLHAFDFEKYAARYLAAVQYRFNRRFDLRDMFPRFTKATARSGKRPERWLRLAEDCA